MKVKFNQLMDVSFSLKMILKLLQYVLKSVCCTKMNKVMDNKQLLIFD